MNSRQGLATPDRSPRRVHMDRVAARLATLGAGLGVIAGVLDVAVGASIRGWIGNKLDPTPLGFLTVILSAIALAGAITWQRPAGRDGGRRLGTILAFLLPAGICFTTIGRLWYLPGVLLLGAAVLVGAAGTRAELAHAVTRHHWLTGLAALLGAYYLFLGGDALPKPVGILGILGAPAIWGALLAIRCSHRLRLVLLIVGALPFAVATWWSAVTPLIAILVLTLGPVAIRPQPAGADASAGHHNLAPASAG